MFNLLNGQTSSARESFLAPEHSQTDIVHSDSTMAPKAWPVWKCKGPSMFNLSRFAGSKCVPLRASPKNIRKGKKTPDGVIPVVTQIK